MTSILSRDSHTSILQTRFPQPDAVKLIPEDMARKYAAIPLSVHHKTLQVAMADPSNIMAIEALANHSQMRIEPFWAGTDEIIEAIDRSYRNYEEIEKKIQDISLPDIDIPQQKLQAETVADAPVAQALSLIVNEATKAGASDIHIQPQETGLRVRYRVDGVLQDIMALPTKMAVPLISRLKIVSNMNIADHHRPQDGQFSTTIRNKSIDIRVATIPTVYGEMAVLRLLDKSRATLALSQLGFLPDCLQKYEQMLNAPYGMILVSGPTGAGKTTTLYSSINSLDCVQKNIITLEDPVEYRFKNVNQIQVNTKAGMTFASGLRSILRLDPDIILVGEIRDAETAQIAVQSALTGHLVLSSIHSNDAVSVVFRLLDLGIEPFLVSSALLGIIAQRMVRQICPHCGTPMEVPLMEKLAYQREIGTEQDKFIQGTGCQYCNSTGYKGRTGLFELLSISDEMRTLILSGTDTAKLHACALRQGMVTLMKDGMSKVRDGITTPSEVLRNAYTVE